MPSDTTLLWMLLVFVVLLVAALYVTSWLLGRDDRIETGEAPRHDPLRDYDGFSGL